MAVVVPSTPALSAKLQKMVAQLAAINTQTQSLHYAAIQVTLRCDAEGYVVRDFWIAAPPPGVAGVGGHADSPPPYGIKTAATLTPTTTASQCDTIAATMIAAIKVVSGPTYVVE